MLHDAKLRVCTCVHVCVCLFLYLCVLLYSLCVSIISGKAGRGGTNFNTLYRIQFLNQAHAGRSSFLEIAFVREVCVCVSAPGLLKTIHMK